MKNTKLTGLCLFLLVLLISGTTGRKDHKPYKSLESLLDSLRLRYNIPAIAYGVIRNDSILVEQTIGYRNIETKEKVSLGDLFHIGSNTKSLTSFLAGKLVEDGSISWDTRFFDLYPELKAESNQAYGDITLLQLLSHRARLIKFENESEVYPIVDYEKNIDKNLSLPDKRYGFIKQVLRYDPIPLYDFHDNRYSNAGYIAAALMLEKVTGKHWEELITGMSDELKLGIHIGWPDSNDSHQPRGHINPEKWKIDSDKALIPIPQVLKNYHYFNQYVLLCSPAGNTSISVDGFLKYLKFNIDGLNGKDNYLKAKTYKVLFNAYPDYSCGWVNEKYVVRCFHHKGSAGTFNSIAVIVPEKKLGIAVLINTFDGEGINEIAKVLINRFNR